MSDGRKRRIDYSVREGLSFLGASWGTEWCVAGLDREYAYAPLVQAGATVRPARLAIAGALFLLAIAPTAAQAGRGEDRGAPPGRFDFYVLALSWSPGFCEIGGPGRGRDQCDAGRDLGFVVHGLWPQSEHGYPSFCEPGGALRAPRRASRRRAGLFPDEGLARYQWRKHGDCSGAVPRPTTSAPCARRARAVPSRTASRSGPGRARRCRSRSSAPSARPTRACGRT